MQGSETRQEVTSKVGTRMFGAVFIVVGYWMVQNFPDIVFQGFGGQSIGPLIFFVAPVGFGLPLLPIFVGSRFLFFPQNGTLKNDGSTKMVVPYKVILTGMGIFTVFMALALFGASRYGWDAADGELVESNIVDLSTYGGDGWELTVEIVFDWEEINYTAHYQETFTSIDEAERTQNRINNMEHITVEFDSSVLNAGEGHVFPELRIQPSIDIFSVICVFGILALGLTVRDLRSSKNAEVSNENE